MPTARKALVLGLLQIAGLTFGPVHAFAQEGGVATSGMGQGEASINVRSDVKLGIKGTAGTTSERLTKLGAAVSDKMPDIRACYRKQVANSPEVIGGLRVALTLAEGGKPKVEVTAQDEQAGKTLVGCVTKVLEKAKFESVGRPAAALITLDFDNSRARGQSVMNERASQTARVEIHAAPDGRQEAVWSTDDNAITFTVRAEANTPRENLELVVRGFHGGYAAFLDCRRHSEKGGTSAEGDIEATVQVDKQGKSTVKVGKITVANARTPRCAEQSFRLVAFEKPSATVHTDVIVHFTK